MAFLTDLDSRAAIKGSRDPLATQSIWVPLGRRVVGNLTTVSTSVRDFTVLMLGFWFVQRALDEGTQESDLALFMKWEQLCGYARVQTGVGGFRGVDRVKANLAQGSKVTLSADRSHQILGNQKIYGLWGLYTVPGRSSGLLSEDPLRLTPRAREFVERVYVSALAKAGLRDGDAIVRLLMPPACKVDVEGKEKPIIRAIGSLLRPDKYSTVEREFYDEVLVRGGPLDGTEGRQARLAAILQQTSDDDDFAFTPATMDQLVEDVGDDGKPGSLAERLQRIRHCETVLAPATRLFLYLLGRHGKRIVELAGDVRKTWGPSLKHLDLPRILDLRQELVSIMGSAEAAERWLDVARDLAGGEYEALIERLIAHNKHVMQQRGGAAPWIELRDERIHVAFRDEDGRLPERKELPTLWRSSYFLDSLRSVVSQVRGGAS